MAANIKWCSMRFIATEFFRPLRSFNCVCVWICVVSLTISHTQCTHILPCSPGSIFTVHPLLQTHSVTMPYRLSLPSPPLLSLSLYPPLSPLPVTFTVRFNGWAWSKPIMACFERAGHPVEALHYRQLVPIHLSLHMCIHPSISPSLVLVLHVVIHSSHSCCIQ